MISQEDVRRIRDQLQVVLEEDAHNVQRLLARLDAIAGESGIAMAQLGVSH